MFAWCVQPTGAAINAQDRKKITKIIRNGNSGLAVSFVSSDANFVAQRSTSQFKKTHKQVLFDPVSGYHICFWGRIDNLYYLCEELEQVQSSDHTCEILLAAWRKYGIDLGPKLQGEFAVSFANFETQHVVLFRDSMGMRPLFYARTDRGVWGASSIACLLAFPEAQFQKNITWAKRYLYSLSLAGSSTDCAYLGIKRVPPGHIVEFKSGKRVSTKRFSSWDPSDVSGREINPSFAVKHRHFLDKAIAKRTPKGQTIGIEASGGLDSSTIIALLDKNHDNKLVTMSTYSNDFERDMIRLCNEVHSVCQHYSCPITYLDAHNVALREVAVLGHPSCQGMELEFEIYETAVDETKIKCIFSGFGGDQVATNFGDKRLRELIAKKQFVRLWKLLPGNKILKPLRMVKLLIRERSIGAKQKYNLETISWFENKTILSSSTEEIKKMSEEMVSLQAVQFEQNSINQEIRNFYLKAEHIQNRFTVHGLLADSFGLQMEWPLCDHELIQNYLATPNIEKLGPGMERRFLHRRSIDDVVPKQIVNTPKSSRGRPIETPKQIDETRKFWAEKVVALKKDLHQELAEICDLNKLEELKKISLNNMGQTILQSDYSFIDAVSALYSLDIWFKQST